MSIHTKLEKVLALWYFPLLLLVLTVAHCSPSGFSTLAQTFVMLWYILVFIIAAGYHSSAHRLCGI